MIDIDNTPLTDAQVWDHPPFVHEGIAWTTIGEDGDYAVARGHGHRNQLLAALTAEGYDELDLDAIEDEWWLFTAHRPGCREDLEDDDLCSCDEYEWWAHQSTEDTPGALPVTSWSA